MNKRKILECLTRNDLLYIARTFEVPGLTGKTRDEVIDGLMRVRIIPAEDVLDALRVTELKKICRDYEISPKSWRKADVIRAITGGGMFAKPERSKKQNKPAPKPANTVKKTREKKVRMPRNTDNQKSIEQYTHDGEERLNNPPVGLVTPDTDKDGAKKEYQYDPHLDPQLVWAGKAEHTSFQVPTVSLHVHERIDPKRIIEQVRKEEESEAEQMSLFSVQEKRPLREAVEFYKHKDGWTNRLIAGDSLIVMNSFLEKEGLGEKVQMVYFDPPYGIKYGSNFQPFVNRREAVDGKDDDLTSEPEMIKAFRDTWELGIHSYLAYLRDRLKLAKELLSESGSAFLQIGDENVHRVGLLMDEVFGAENRIATITFATTSGSSTNQLPQIADYYLWYAKDKDKLKYRQLYEALKREEIVDFFSSYVMVEEANGKCRKLTEQERFKPNQYLPKGCRIYGRTGLDSQGTSSTSRSEAYIWNGTKYPCAKNRHWSVSHAEMDVLAKLGRLDSADEKASLRWKKYEDEVPGRRINNIWPAQMYEADKDYVVQTATSAIQRCMLMTTDPGDLVLDITCGSGTSGVVAEEWGRRWITCDTSRVAITLAKQRIMTSQFRYFKLVHPEEGVSSGFDYRSVPKVSPKVLASGSPPPAEILYDQPRVMSNRMRITGPFTVEAVPAPTVKSFEDIEHEDTGISDDSVTRSGETLRQSEWRQELLKTGVRGKNGQYIKFSRIEPMSGTLYIQAEGETTWCDAGANSVGEEPKGWKPQKVLICFGPEHAPLEQRTVENAWQEARAFKPDLLLFCAFQFDEEAAKDIDELPQSATGMQLLKVQMNADLLTDDLRKKRSSNESFWLIGQPEVEIREIKKGEHKGKHQVEVLGFDYYNPKTGNVESGGKHQIAMWMLDTNYDGRSLFPSQVFFPMAGAKEGWATLARNLKAEIDEEKIEAYRGTESLPFEPGDRKCVAVKIVDDRGIESLKIIRL